MGEDVSFLSLTVSLAPRERVRVRGSVDLKPNPKLEIFKAPLSGSLPA
jgi:hypothetical protein